MPARTPTPCRARGCGALVSDRSGYCETHKSDSWKNFRAGKSASQRGYGTQWRKQRAAALRRDRGLCVLCIKQGRVEAATDVDHIIPKAQGGTDDVDNLQSLCRCCHQQKTARECNARN